MKNLTSYIATGVILVSAFGAFAAISTVKPSTSSTSTPPSNISSVTEPVAAASVERYACEEATKMQLRDPDSYQKIIFEDLVDGSAALNFRSRNGFGGYADGAAVCTVEGTGVRSIIVGQN